MSQADTVCGVPSLIDMGIIRESISKRKNTKSAGPLGIVSEILKQQEKQELT